MFRTTIRAGTPAAAPQSVILSVVRCDGPAVIPRRHSQRPAWSLLCAIAFLALVALLAIDFLLPEGLARSVAYLLAIFGSVGLTRLWIGVNRRAFSRPPVVPSKVGESGASGVADSKVK